MLKFSAAPFRVLLASTMLICLMTLPAIKLNFNCLPKKKARLEVGIFINGAIQKSSVSENEGWKATVENLEAAVDIDVYHVHSMAKNAKLIVERSTLNRDFNIFLTFLSH